MRRPLASALLALVLALALVAVPPSPVRAADDTTTTEPLPGGEIIPEPGSGREPEDAGDRGGGLQTVLFVGIVVVVVGAGAYLVVQSRKARAGRGF
ncbi:MAG: hypothetical protein ACLGIC_04240 [Acidimicrobiia bacterium]